MRISNSQFCDLIDFQKKSMKINPDISLFYSEDMTRHEIFSAQSLFSQYFHIDTDDFPVNPPAPSATPVSNLDEDLADISSNQTLLSNVSSNHTELSETNYEKIKLEVLKSVEQPANISIDFEDTVSLNSSDDLTIQQLTPPIVDEDSGQDNNIVVQNDQISDNDQLTAINCNNSNINNKNWSKNDMESALVALRSQKMNLTKASSTYGIPATTLWVHAHRKGIDTPKKEGNPKSYNEDNLNLALDALRSGRFSANKASKTFGIPSSTLYKIAKREGIRLTTPFNATPTNWTSDDLEKALEAIRTGQSTVQKASVEFGIPAGTLYGRCKREGIELSRSGITPWSEGAMGEALEAVKVGTMSINQAAIHYNLPYSSLYGRVKRLKLDHDPHESTDFDLKNIETQYLNCQNQSELSN